MRTWAHNNMCGVIQIESRKSTKTLVAVLNLKTSG